MSINSTLTKQRLKLNANNEKWNILKFTRQPGGQWSVVVTSSVTFIKSVNQSSIKPCLIVHLVAMWTLIYFICEKSMVKLLLQGSTGSRTSESALLSIAVICISITVVKKTMCFHRVWDFGFLYGVLKDTSSWSVLVFLFWSYHWMNVKVPYRVCMRYSLVHSVNSLLWQLRNFLGRGVLQFERTTDVYQKERET